MTNNEKIRMFTCWQVEALQRKQTNDSIDCFVTQFDSTKKTAKNISRGIVKLFDCIDFVINNIDNVNIQKHSLQEITLLKVVFTDNQGDKIVYNFNAGALHDANDKKIKLYEPFKN